MAIEIMDLPIEHGDFPGVPDVRKNFIGDFPGMFEWFHGDVKAISQGFFSIFWTLVFTWSQMLGTGEWSNP